MKRHIKAEYFQDTLTVYIYAKHIITLHALSLKVNS
jgi:hypothetical protein